MLAAPLCRSCGSISDRVEWVVHDGEVVVANFWCSHCDEPGLISTSAFVDRRTASLPSIATASANNSHVHSSSTSTMLKHRMEHVGDVRNHSQDRAKRTQELV